MYVKNTTLGLIIWIVQELFINALSCIKFQHSKLSKNLIEQFCTVCVFYFLNAYFLHSMSKYNVEFKKDLL